MRCPRCHCGSPPGTVHGLLGENGAGKSTLVKCLLGYYKADQGGFVVDGREATIERPADADALGLGMVYQHFTLVPSMTVAENLVMSRQTVPGVINWRAEIAGLKQFMERMPFKVPLEVEVGTLAAGERQKTEIIKQLYLERKFLVLDEPTSVLTPQEATEMLGLVRGLAHSGALTIVIITHKLKEVAAFVDEVTVLRRGRMAGTGMVKDLGPADLTAMMIGEPHAPKNPERKGGTIQRNPPRSLCPAHGRRQRPQGPVDQFDHGPLATRSSASPVSPATARRTWSKSWAASGPQNPARLPWTAPRTTPAASSPKPATSASCPRNRCGTAASPPMTVVDNLNLRSFDLGPKKSHRGWLDRAGMATRANDMITAYGIRTPSPQAPIGVLSGGNVQRCVLARELDGDVRLLIVANPCFGLDVKAVAETRARIMAARNAGTAVLLISEDLDEILELADRIVVMHEGRVAHTKWPPRVRTPRKSAATCSGTTKQTRCRRSGMVVK